MTKLFANLLPKAKLKPFINQPTTIMVRKEKRVGMFKKVKEDELTEIKPEQERLKWMDRAKLNLFPTKTFLITMHFSNGTTQQFVIYSKKETFDYKKRTYYLRYEDAWFDITYKLYRLNYFDDFPCPIDRKVVKISQTGDKSMFTVSPENLKPLIEMEYVKALASAHQITQWLKMCMLLSGGALLMGIINAFMLYKIMNPTQG